MPIDEEAALRTELMRAQAHQDLIGYLKAAAAHRSLAPDVQQSLGRVHLEIVRFDISAWYATSLFGQITAAVTAAVETGDCGAVDDAAQLLCCLAEIRPAAATVFSEYQGRDKIKDKELLEMFTCHAGAGIADLLGVFHAQQPTALPCSQQQRELADALAPSALRTVRALVPIAPHAAITARGNTRRDMVSVGGATINSAATCGRINTNQGAIIAMDLLARGGHALELLVTYQPLLVTVLGNVLKMSELGAVTGLHSFDRLGRKIMNIFLQLFGDLSKVFAPKEQAVAAAYGKDFAVDIREMLAHMALPIVEVHQLLLPYMGLLTSECRSLAGDQQQRLIAADSWGVAETLNRLEPTIALMVERSILKVLGQRALLAEAQQAERPPLSPIINHHPGGLNAEDVENRSSSMLQLGASSMSRSSSDDDEAVRPLIQRLANLTATKFQF